MAETGEDRAPEGGDATLRAVVGSVLGWIVPGAGHVYLGRRGRGLAFFCVVGSFIALGLLLGGKLYVPLGGQPLSFLASFADLGMGPLYLALVWMGRVAGEPVAVTYEHGTTFLLSAGIMNLLLLLDVWDIALGRKP